MYVKIEMTDDFLEGMEHIRRTNPDAYLELIAFLKKTQEPGWNPLTDPQVVPLTPEEKDEVARAIEARAQARMHEHRN